MEPTSFNSHFLVDPDADVHDPRDSLDSDADTASQRSISLSSPAVSPRQSSHIVDPPYLARRDTVSTFSTDNDSLFGKRVSSVTSPSPSTYQYDHKLEYDTITPSASASTATYPPPPIQGTGRESVTSFGTSESSSSRKARPESVLVDGRAGPLVLGIALVDFNHQVGPRIEFSKGTIFDDEEIAKILPFLALPDGAHLTVEDYSYFHLVPTTPNPSTIFGISCNRQIATSTLLVKEPDMTRSTVQKAVVVLASKPVFGPIRDRLGVITLALFEQKDFTDTSILGDFYDSIELSLRSQLTESGLYMGTNLRELVHQFRHRILVIVKALILQKKALILQKKSSAFAHINTPSSPSFQACLLQTLEDCGSPPLASRAPTLSRPNSLRTSDRKSLLAYLGLPLDLFGKNSFFQPYLPLQQLDLIKTQAFLCGSTNSIVTQQRDVELLVNVETGAVEFRDPKIERAVALTAADRKWMDEIVRDVNESWEAEESGASHAGMQFKGSDDYLRTKFEEYISAALASVKYGDFLAKGESSGVLITPGAGGDANALEDFNPIWIAEFKHTNAYEVWQRVTDPMLFDIVEPRHPCGEKPSAISDIGLRLAEGIQELKIEQQLAPTREAISRTLTAGSTNFFKAMEGVKGRWMQRSASSSTVTPEAQSPEATPPVEISKKEAEGAPPAAQVLVAQSPASERNSTWSAGFGSFFSSRTPRFSGAKDSSPPASVNGRSEEVIDHVTLGSPVQEPVSLPNPTSDPLGATPSSPPSQSKPRPFRTTTGLSAKDETSKEETSHPLLSPTPQSKLRPFKTTSTYTPREDRPATPPAEDGRKPPALQAKLKPLRAGSLLAAREEPASPTSQTKLRPFRTVSNREDTSSNSSTKGGDDKPEWLSGQARLKPVRTRTPPSPALEVTEEPIAEADQTTPKSAVFEDRETGKDARQDELHASDERRHSDDDDEVPAFGVAL
ncbi:transport protein Avl9-domain-containing protein [Amylostereum chailletii]|nr:transport protein Avl9-domain-containing protein [Amylostereum chailletii]